MIPILQWPIYSGWVWNTPVVPNMYWNVYSAEQRWKNTCLNIGKMSAYLDNVAEQTNTWVDDVSEYVDDELQETQQKIDDLSEFATQHGYDALVGFLPRDDVKNTRQTELMQEYDVSTGINRNVAYPPLCISNRTGMVNPLPILRLIGGYMQATDLAYGNDWTATNVNTNFSDWQLPVYIDGTNKYPIDCATFCLLLTLGIPYATSSYRNRTTPNIGSNDYIDMFCENTKKYINSPAGYSNNPNGIEAKHRRLLGSVWAKLLYDNGMLRRVKYNNSIGQLMYRIYPGDIVFFSNVEEEDYRWEHIGHCAIVVAVSTQYIVIAEADNTNIGPYNSTIKYTVLRSGEVPSENKARQIKWVFTPNEMNPLTTDNIDGMQTAYPDQNRSVSNLAISGTSEFVRTAFLGGYAVIYNNNNTSKTFTYNLRIPTRVSEGASISYVLASRTITLGAYNSTVIILAPNIGIQIPATNYPYTIKWCNIISRIDSTPYIPA